MFHHLLAGLRMPAIGERHEVGFADGSREAEPVGQLVPATHLAERHPSRSNSVTRTRNPWCDTCPLAKH